MLKRFALTGCACLLLGLAAAPCAVSVVQTEPFDTLELAPLKAVYNVRIGNFGTGKGEMELRADGDGLSYRMVVAPTGLLATMFGDAVEINARMRLEGGRVIAEEYTKEYRRNKSRNQHYRFDPNRSSVEMLEEGKTRFLEAPDGTLDEASMQLQLILDARRHDGPWLYAVASNDKIKRYRFAEIGTEHIDSAFGRVETVKIQRIRLRATGKSEIDYYYWLSPAHRYLPVRAEKLEDGKTERVLTVREISFD